jgi:imidazolonepropionase-like amidohydrolase
MHSSRTTPDTGDLVLWNARIIDSRNSSPRDRAAVTVRDGRIAEVNDTTGAVAPDGALDLNGRFVLPGLIDSHIHLGEDPKMLAEFAPPKPAQGEEPRPRELVYFVLANAAREFLRAGITTIRDVGCYDDNAITLREAIRLGMTAGPRVLSCGRILSATAHGRCAAASETSSSAAPTT